MRTKDKLAGQPSGSEDVAREDFHARERCSPADTLATIWDRHYPSMLERIGLIERAVAALIVGELDDGLRADAQRVAHTLSGSVGTFGFARASETMGELELALTDPVPAQVPALSALIATVRDELESETIISSRLPPAESTHEQPRVLIVDDVRALCARIQPRECRLASIVRLPTARRRRGQCVPSGRQRSCCSI